MNPFVPCYIFASELSTYGLPQPSDQPNIMSLVMSASTLIDQYCGRTDGLGVGSLVYSTVSERLLLQARNRNILRVMFKPLVALSVDVYNAFVASGSNDPNNVYTGFMPNTVVLPDASVSPMLGASGRYGYPRRGEAAIYPDLNYGMNLLQVAAYFGGPPGFTLINPAQIDVDWATGEIWVPAGIYMSQYTELIVQYNSGYNPIAMPFAIKHACAALVRNLLSRAGGTTGIKSIQAQGTLNVTFDDDLVDSTIQRWLAAYVNVVVY